jgi:hypothetical protein
MAHTVSVTKTSDGDRFLILRVLIHGDGTAPDLSNYLLFDPADLNSQPVPITNMALVEAWYDLNGFAVRVKYDAPVDQTAWVFTPGASNHIDFRPVGPLANATGIDGTGALLIDTFGVVSTSNIGMLILKFRKS